MTTSWLHTHYYMYIIIHKAKQRSKSVGKKEQTQKVCENKETDSPFGINRMKLAGTCSLLKESHEKKKKKMGLLFLGSGTPTFWLGLLLFIKRESRTPTFKILVRTLNGVMRSCPKHPLHILKSVEFKDVIFISFNLDILIGI